MAAGPVPKRKPLTVVPANDAGPRPRPASLPANDNRPHWLRWIAGGALITVGIAVLLYFSLR